MIDSVPKCAARFVTINYSRETVSMIGILEELKWETVQKRRKENSLLILLYKGLFKIKARIPTVDLIRNNRRCRNQHSMAFQIPSASKDVYEKSFFPQTIRDWNDLPDSLISSAKLSDDCVSKFTYLFLSFFPSFFLPLRLNPRGGRQTGIPVYQVLQRVLDE